jgi:hypothetical protein
MQRSSRFKGHVTLRTQGSAIELSKQPRRISMDGDDVFEAGRRTVSLSMEPILDPIRQLKTVMSVTVHSS